MSLYWVGAIVAGLVTASAAFLLLRRRQYRVVTLSRSQREARERGGRDLEHMVRAGKKTEAVRAWRERHGGGFKDPVEREAGSVQAMSEEPSRQVTDTDIELQLRTGNLINAVKLYREKTGVGVREARDAVETMRHRMRAS